jgi:hypothetical protein
MKEIFDAFNSRLKSPVFGYFIMAFLVINWKVLFYLFASDSTIEDRFTYFDVHTNTFSLLFQPLIIGICGAIFYPWISLLFIWLVRRPIELRQLIHLTSQNKLLIKEKEFEETRGKLLATKEKELIERVKRDEEIKSLPDDRLRKDLQKQIEDLREQLDDNSKIPYDVKNSNGLDLSGIYVELAKLQKKNGNMERAERYLQQAAQIRMKNSQL